MERSSSERRGEQRDHGNSRGANAANDRGETPASDRTTADNRGASIRRRESLADLELDPKQRWQWINQRQRGRRLRAGDVDLAGCADRAVQEFGRRTRMNPMLR